ncbi:MAG: Gfo/Idh/MocA family oxidoreductase [Candidatus Omnitrophica bacterium]|nr:Gfo/Idh/MocA family oxidoreductase [Candidatus Omnitrophota bacterium]MCM8817262.1 Gfo/Idh/MocA family oxidoreductase [Candidatus Omnitrophota bacterium]
MNRLNTLVIGGGMITKQVILPVLAQEKRKGKISSITVASRRKETIQQLKDIFPQENLKGYPEKNDEQPDAWKIALKNLEKPGLVIIATPDDLHAEMCLEAIEYGFDVIVQKPLCLKTEDAKQILNSSREKGCYVFTDLHKRHDLALRALQYKYTRGEMGEVLCCHAWHEQRRDIPLKYFKNWCERSSPLEYLGTHYIDMFYFVTGLKPEKVIAKGQKKLLKSLGYDAFDACQAFINWENGAVEYLQTSWILPEENPCLSNQGFQMTCTQGEFRADNANRNSNFSTTKNGYELFNPYFFKPYIDWDNPEIDMYLGYGADSIIQAIDDCIRILNETSGLKEKQALEKRKQLLSEFEKTRPLPNQAIISVSVIEAGKMSMIKDGKPVIIDDDFFLHYE